MTPASPLPPAAPDPAPQASGASADPLDALADREFPLIRLGETAYLNSASTGPIPERARRALDEFNNLRGEPWRLSQELQFDTLERARGLIARLVGAEVREIATVVNTSYGLNFAARALPLAPGDVVVSSDREFPSNVYPWMALERARGVRFEQIPCNSRLADEAAILAALDRPRVRALVLSWVSFETGLRVDLARLGRACRARGIWFVVDAIQGVGAAPLDLASLEVDVLACGAQKWLTAPWGTGFLYVNRRLLTRLEPVDVGWMSVRDSDDFTNMLAYDFTYRDDARRFEVVTLPYQDFAALNASLEIVHEAGAAAVTARVAAHAGRLVAWAEGRRDMTLVTPADPARRAGIVTVVPPDAPRASAALTAAGVIHSLREGAIRLSPHWFTPAAHVERAMEALERAAR